MGGRRISGDNIDIDMHAILVPVSYGILAIVTTLFNQLNLGNYPDLWVRP